MKGGLRKPDGVRRALRAAVAFPDMTATDKEHFLRKIENWPYVRGEYAKDYVQGPKGPKR